MNSKRIFRSAPEEIKHVIDIQGDFTAKLKEPESISGYGNIHWAIKSLTIFLDKSGNIYLNYRTENEWGRYYKPLSSSYIIHPDKGVIEENDNDDPDEYELMHITDPTEERWGSPWHAMAVYEEIFGEIGAKPKAKYQVYSNLVRGMIDISKDVVEMTSAEFDKIREDKETPQFVHLTDKQQDIIYYNDYTCLNGFDGTCWCLSHPRKSWSKWSIKENCWL